MPVFRIVLRKVKPAKRVFLPYTMGKRELTPTDTTDTAAKRTRVSNTFAPIKVATVEAAAAVDSNPPFLQLEEAMKKMVNQPQEGESVIYWMRMADLRSEPCSN
jgi:deoxyribodipyrimidine photo-lyase